MRHIKDYKNMSKEGLLISLLKSGRSVAELHKNNSDNIAIEKTRKKFNELRDKFSRSKLKKIRKKLYRTEKRRIFLDQKKKRLNSILLNQKKRIFLDQKKKRLNNIIKNYLGKLMKTITNQ